MYNLINFFTTREWAIIFWAVLAFVLVTAKTDVNIIKNMFVAIFNKHLIRLFLVIATYTAILIFGLYRIGFWSINLFKYTIFAVFFIALASCFKLATEEDKKDVLNGITKKAITWTILITFLTNTYTFSFWAEVGLVAAMVILGFVEANAKIEENYAVVKFCKGTTALLGLIILGWSVNQVFQKPEEFFTCVNLSKLIFKPIMLFLYLPLFFAFVQVELFRMLFRQTNNHARKQSEKLIRYFKFRLLQKYLIRMKELEKFPVRKLVKLNNVNSKSEVDSFLKIIRDDYKKFDKPLEEMTVENRKIVSDYTDQIFKMIDLVAPIIESYKKLIDEYITEEELVAIVTKLKPEIERLDYGVDRLSGLEDLSNCCEALASNIYCITTNYGTDYMLSRTPENRKISMDNDVRSYEKNLKKFKKLEAQLKGNK